MNGADFMVRLLLVMTLLLLYAPTVAAEGGGSYSAGALTQGLPTEDVDQDGYSAAAGDCDDSNPQTHPGALEIEDGQDNNCNGLIDESQPIRDVDGDGLSENGGDCDDHHPAIGPHRDEIPGDGVDNDCDGQIDESEPESPTMMTAFPGCTSGGALSSNLSPLAILSIFLTLYYRPRTRR